MECHQDTGSGILFRATSMKKPPAADDFCRLFRRFINGAADTDACADGSRDDGGIDDDPVAHRCICTGNLVRGIACVAGTGGVSRCEKRYPLGDYGDDSDDSVADVYYRVGHCRGAGTDVRHGRHHCVRDFAANGRRATTFLVTSVAFCIGFVVQFLLSFYIMGVDLFAMYQQIMQESTEQAFRTMESTGYNAIELAEAKANYLAQLSQMQRFLPFIVASAGMLLAYLDIRIAQAILKRLGVQVQPFPPIAEWEMPRTALYVYVLAMLAAYFAAQLPWLLSVWPSTCRWRRCTLFGCEGIAVVFWLGRYSGLRILRWPVAIAAVFIPLFLASCFSWGCWIWV